MTGINAGIPKALAEGVKEAQTRGQENDEEPVLGDESHSSEEEDLEDSMCRPPAPAPAPIRRRRGVARLRSAAAGRRSGGSPSGAIGTRRQQLQQHVQAGPSTSRPFIAQGSTGIDPFGISVREDPPLRTPQIEPSSDDESTNSADQENDIALSPAKPRETPRKALAGTPRRPHGAPPVPLGELTLEDASPPASPPPSDPELSASDASSMEEEYPPSPRKSPSKSPAKKPPQPNPFFASKAQRSAALFGPTARNFTPPNGLSQPLASNSPYTGFTTGPEDDTTMLNPSPSPRKARTAGVGLFGKNHDPAARNLFGRPAGPPLFGTPKASGKGVRKTPSPPSSAEKRKQRDKRLWELCGRDVRKWNRGEFGDEEGFAMKAARW